MYDGLLLLEGSSLIAPIFIEFIKTNFQKVGVNHSRLSVCLWKFSWPPKSHPDSVEFKEKWETTKPLLKNELLDGKNIIFHCRGGKGRAGTVAAILLIDFGYDKKEAIDLVRSKRVGAIETEKQEKFI